MVTLPLLMERLGNIDPRRRMALAALRAGMAFSNTRTALAHSISYEMTLRYGLPHGIACSFQLPMVLERALGVCADRDAVLAQALGEPLDEAPRRLAAFIERLGVKTRFADYGVSDGKADRMVTHALTGARGKNFIGTLSKEAARERRARRVPSRGSKGAAPFDCREADAQSRASGYRTRRPRHE